MSQSSQSVDTPSLVEYPIKLVIPSSLPSWNAVLALHHWGRAKLKEEIQKDFLSALKTSATDSSTRIISQRSTMSIAYDTLVSYREMRQAKRKSRLAKKRLDAKKALGSKSK